MSAPTQRKTVPLAQTAARGNRQKIWNWIRQHRTVDWSQKDLITALSVKPATVREYVRGLCKAGFVREANPAQPPAQAQRRSECRFQLDKDNGVHAPRVDRDGRVATLGRLTEALWGTMRRSEGDWNYCELTAWASTEAHPVAPETAKAYVQALNAAGYLRITQAATRGCRARAARYSLLPKHRHKPLPPMLQKIGAVYDPNEGRVVWMEACDD